MERIYRHLKTATYGIVFLGTPHRGSKKANLATKFISIAKMRYPGILTETIKSLQTNSRELEDLADNFRNMHSQFEIVSFYETIPKNKWGLVGFSLKLICK
jgi:protein SERAC1